ncbi:MAG: sterol desaturase family protein [Actinomycetota bacterium]
MTSATAPGPGRADAGVALAASITSLRLAAQVFSRFGSPRVLAAGFVVAAVVRAVTIVTGSAPLTAWDLAAVAVVAILVPFVEWLVHRFVLHIDPLSIGSLRFDPGVGHREHHDNPSTINWVLLRAVDAALFLAINAAVAVVVVGGPLWLTGRPVLGPASTGVLMAAAALAHYEWSHFLFHTAYRPRTSRYRRLKANHRRHHWRDDRAWLGITSNLADRAFRTLSPRPR